MYGTQTSIELNFNLVVQYSVLRRILILILISYLDNWRPDEYRTEVCSHSSIFGIQTNIELNFDLIARYSVHRRSILGAKTNIELNFDLVARYLVTR